jgi:hypothetical protein
MHRLVCFLLLAASMPAQITSPPVMGFIRDRAGALRPVHGVAGSFLLGEAIETGVLSASFSDRLGFAKTESELLVFENGSVAARVAAPDGPAIFTWKAGDRLGQVLFSNSGECARWTGSRLVPISCETNPAATLPAGAPEPTEGIEQMSDGWLIIRADKGLYSVREETVYRLPEAER